MKWNPNYFNETVSKTLESINDTRLLEIKGNLEHLSIPTFMNINRTCIFLLEKIQETSTKLLTNFKSFNGRIDAIDSTKYVIFTSYYRKILYLQI